VITKAIYQRGIERHGCYYSLTPIELEAECFQDSGEGFGSEVLVVWTDTCLALLASLDLDGDELVGCTEAIEEAFFAAEREACRVSKVRQQQGSEVAA
jgi:hypothetical protein